MWSKDDAWHQVETNSPDIRFRQGKSAGGRQLSSERWHPVVVETNPPPVYGYDQKAAVSFTIDGKEYAYEFQGTMNGRREMKYTYTLKMTETTTPRSTWSRRTSMWSTGAGMARRTRLYSTQIGRLSFQGMAQLYRIRLWLLSEWRQGVRNLYNPYCDNGEGRVTVCIYEAGYMNEIVEQFQPIDIKTNGAWDGKRISAMWLAQVHTSLCRYSARKEKRCGAGQVGYSYAVRTRNGCMRWKRLHRTTCRALRMMEVEGQGYTSILAYRFWWWSVESGIYFIQPGEKRRWEAK